MTQDQITHLEAWLERNQNVHLSIGRWSGIVFLRIVATEPLDDDQEVFHVPLDGNNSPPIKLLNEES